MTNTAKALPSRNTVAQEKVFEVFIDAFAGATGGVLAALLFYPLENLRTRLQAGNLAQESASDAPVKKRTTL